MTTTTTFPKPDDPVHEFTRPDGTTEGHDEDHGRVIGIWENVKHHGAAGNGTTDDTAAITRAIIAADAKSGHVYFPSGTYKITSTIVLDTYQNITFHGAGNVTGSVPGIARAGAVIDSRTITTGPAFSYDGGVDSQDARHHWENIYIQAGRTGWKYRDCVMVTWQNSSGRCFTNDGHADNTVALIINSFWLYFDGGGFQAPSTSRPAVILRGETFAVNVTSVYLVFFSDLRFVFGGVWYEWNTGGAVTADGIHFRRIQTESFNTTALFTIIESGAHGAASQSGLYFESCYMFDQTGSCPILKINAADLTVVRPTLINCSQQVGSEGVLVSAGAVANVRIINPPATFLGSKAQDGSGNYLSQTLDRDDGRDIIQSVAGDSSTALSSRNGPSLRFAKTSDTYARHGISADGTHYWGPGGAAATGWDVQLARSAAAKMQYTGQLQMISGALSQKTVGLSDAASIAVDASLGNVFLLTATAGRTIAAPTNGTSGQVVCFKVKNASGGAMVTTWNGAFHLGGAWVDPANGFARTISFMFDGSQWYELGRSAADIA